jgi:hypothetical protein
MTRKPDFIIIGAMKCATSTLHDQLGAQPGLFVSTPKEPNFFSDEPQWRRGLDWYFGLFAHAKPGDLCGESSTHYTKLPTHARVVDRLAEHVPQAKFIYVMRHPIDRLVSHYVHEWTQRVIDVPLAAAIDLHPELVQYGQYAMQLRPYVERFGRERILPVFFDRLRAHPQAELERVCRFIGYAGTPTWGELPPSNVSEDRMRKSKLRDLLVDAPVLSVIRRRLVPKWVRERVKQLWMMTDRPELGDAERRRLVALFDPDLAELGRALGIDLRCDNFVEQTRDRPLHFVDPFAARGGPS